MNINYFGKPCSFTHIAALRAFGKKEKYFSKNTIEDAFNSIKENSIAVVPIENTFGGEIIDTVNAMFKYKNTGLEIKEELELNIDLYLLGKNKNLSKIKKIYSHAYPLKVFEEWIKKYLPTAKVESVASTSEAALKVVKERYSCAIASREAAEHYNLNNLTKIEIEGKRNITRFFVMGVKK